ncbi:MAG: hypothetical protein DMG13_25905 [Acidobacteria bacterium]|nr:MAG: hypothetical protein DMG13_25905 [Acidobacteriota bacterium]
MTIEIEVPDGESASLDFKSCFDPESKQDWCELIKDLVAMSNSGGGTIIVGVDDDGNLSNADVAPLLAVDPTTAVGQACRRDHSWGVTHPDCVHGTWRLCSTGRRPEGRLRQGKRLLSAWRKE